MFREDFLRMRAFIEANVISYRRVEDNTLLRRVSRAVGSHIAKKCDKKCRKRFFSGQDCDVCRERCRERLEKGVQESSDKFEVCDGGAKGSERGAKKEPAGRGCLDFS